MKIIALFFTQGLKSHDFPCNIRANCLIALIFVMSVLYSSLLSSEIVEKLMTASYEADIRTIEDLANSKLLVEWANHPYWQRDFESLTVNYLRLEMN